MKYTLLSVITGITVAFWLIIVVAYIKRANACHPYAEVNILFESNIALKKR
jgi:hypothetical protein